MGLFKKNLGIFKINDPRVQVSYAFVSLSISSWHFFVKKTIITYLTKDTSYPDTK